MYKRLFYVIISARARTVSTDDLNDLHAVWSVQQQELPGEMPETDRFSAQGINEHIFSIQTVYLNWCVHSRSHMGKSPKLSTIPTWKTPVTVDQLLCQEAVQWSAHHLISLGSSWANLGINDSVCWVSPGTQLYHSCNYRASSNFILVSPL